MLSEELQVPSRDTPVAEAIRQMARDVHACEVARKADLSDAIERTTTYLRNRLGRTPTPNEVARTGGVDVEDVLDEVARRRRGPRGFSA